MCRYGAPGGSHLPTFCARVRSRAHSRADRARGGARRVVFGARVRCADIKRGSADLARTNMPAGMAVNHAYRRFWRWCGRIWLRRSVRILGLAIWGRLVEVDASEGDREPLGGISGATNPFADAELGQLYDQGRPFLQGRAVQRISELVHAHAVGRALDVACGTGLSSLALVDLADVVVGAEIAPGMLAAGRRHPSIYYVSASAECLPFPDAAFGAATVASGVHWFDQRRFFAEAGRVLSASGWLGIYDHYFLGEMEDVPEFSSWMRESFDTRYPTPPRGNTAATTETPRGFQRLGSDEYLDVVQMTHRGLVNYLLTQSNTTVAVARGRESRATVRSWLRDETKGFFERDRDRRLRFWTVIASYEQTTR
jgi:SAM-dependent methyltransferase